MSYDRSGDFSAPSDWANRVSRHNISNHYYFKWFGTGRFTGMGTEICVPIRFNVAKEKRLT